MAQAALVQQLQAIFVDFPSAGAAGALADAGNNIERAVELVLNDMNKYSSMVEAPAVVDPSPVDPVPTNGGPDVWLEKIRQEQLEIERELARKKQKEQDDRDALELAATLKLLEEEENQRRLEEEKRSEAIIAELMAEQAAARAVEEENERATKALLEQERIQRERELDQRRYPCQICGDEYILPSMYTLDECSHKYCRDCLRQYVEAKVNDNRVKDIRCPEPGCEHILGHHEAKHVLSKELFQRFDFLLFKKSLESDPNCRFCPRAGCGTAMIGDSKRPMLICPEKTCKFTFCFNCREEWHADATCEQYQEWKKENSQVDQLFSRWAAEHSKTCPSCHVKIEKNGGCNHMSCDCGFEFCWVCLGDWDDDHYECDEYS